MSFRGVGLFEFLVEAELQQYYNNFKNDLKVQNISQLKWVTEEDLDSIGLSKPEIRRLKKYSNKFCAQNYLSKVRNKLMGRRETSLPAVPPLAASLYVSQPPHIVKSPPKHIIPSDAIVVNKELGTGEFGVVQQGVWTNDDGHRIQVAIKCLSKERMQSNPTEFLKEATIMHNIEHEHIVRLYGVVLENNTLMLVTELAPLRSLLECLKEPNLRPSFPVLTMCGFAVQICDGMHYLESKRLIHRDLAARNILVFSKNTVKISDFGLSRMLGVGKDYYQTNFNVNLKLPIAWCAPECINYLRFTSASDVWAFGVTLWEMFSYGFQPWAALTGQQILEAIDEPSFQRLEQPDACPKEYYRLMLQCWQHVPAQRPDFYQLTQLLPECKPEQVQAVEMASAPPSAAAPLKRERTLAYVIGEIVTVLDKRPLEDHPNMWKGVTNSGKTGLFNPSHFVAYIGSNLPRNSEARGSFGRGDAKTAYSSKRRLKPEMISAPQNDLKHTVHVGMDGTLFGDVSFLGDKYQQLPSRHGSLRQDRQDEAAAPLAMARADAEISDRAPLLSAGAAAAAAGGALEPLQRTAGKLAAAGGAKHEYHEINSESGAPAAAAGAQSLVDLERSQPSSQVCSEPDPFDLGPSLMDEVMSVLAPSCLSAVQPKPRDRIMSDESASGGEISNMCNEIREQGARYLREQSERKGKEPRMRDISESDRRTLEHAIAMANDLAARSMAALDAEPLDTPCTPSSPSKKKFTFKLKPSPPLSRRNFSSEAASIQDVQASLREKEREAYDILVQRTPQVQSALPIAAVQPTCHSIQDADESPLRLLRDRVGKQRKAIINAATIDRSQGVDRSKRKAVNGASGAGRETPPQLSPTKNGTGLQSWQRTMSIDRHLDAAPVSFDEPDDGGHNALPLPPRDRNKSSQDTSSKLRHQRKHPLVIPSSVPTTLPEMEPPSSFPAPVSLNAGCASRSDMSASSSSLFTASSLPRGSPPAKPPRLNLSSSLGEPPLPPAPLSASAVDGVAAAWCSTGDLLYTWRDHVSCEDLLEFAADRPNWRRTRGPAHGAHSDEVRIMLKVLGATADRQACVAALDRTGWDVHKAIKLRQAVSAVDSRVPAAEVAGALQQLDWDVNKAVEALTARHAAVGEPTVV